MIRAIKREISRFKSYIYDQSIDIKDRSFMVFSITVLAALFAAIPCGLIMREPLMATLSTVAGTIFFTIYLVISVNTNTIKQARIVISVILVFAFLPGMFFTNGGVEGGTPIWLLLGTVYIALILDGTLKAVMLIINSVVMIATWIVGYIFPDIVSQYSRGGNYFDSIAALFIIGAILYVLFDSRGIFSRSTVKRKRSEGYLTRLRWRW